jgi:PilZ domain-containing protein
MVKRALQEDASEGSAGQSASYFRRRTLRVKAGESLYAFWSCDGRDGLSRVHDLSLGGLFVESPLEESLGAPVQLHFLADEGRIRANAVVRHVRPGKGLGLRLTTINDQDCQRLAGLIRSVRTNLNACSSG